MERACELARENKMKIALDLASFNVVEAKLPDFREIIENYADIIFANEEEAKSFTGLSPFEALDVLSGISEIAVIKMGSEGSLIKRGEEIIKIGTIPVDCIDTTGAGDLYASGFLYGYANELSLEKCGMFGSILAGHVIEILGAKMDAGRWRNIIKSLQDEI